MTQAFQCHRDSDEMSRFGGQPAAALVLNSHLSMTSHPRPLTESNVGFWWPGVRQEGQIRSPVVVQIQLDGHPHES